MGSPWSQLTRSADGRVMCCICFEWKTRDELYRDAEDGTPWDVCVPCAPEAGFPDDPGQR